MTVQQSEAAQSTTVASARDLAQEIATVMLQAAQCIQTGDYATARQIYETVLEVLPDHADAHHGLAVVLFRQGELTAAFPHYEAALGTAPGEDQYWADYIDALVAARQTEAAWLALDVAQQSRLISDRLRDALVMRAAMPDQVPDMGSAWRSLNPPKAPTASVQALQGKTGGPPASASRPAPTRQLLRIRELCSAGRAAQAVELALTVTERYPGDIDAWFALMVAQHAAQQYLAIPETARRVLQLRPDHVPCRALYSECLQLLGQYAQAEAEAREAIGRDPANAAAQRVLSMALYELGRIDEALVHGKRSVELAPDSRSMHTTLSGLLQACGDYTAAERHCRRALELDPDNGIAFSNLLFTLAHAKNLDQDTLFAEHKAFGRRFENPAALSKLRHANDRTPGRPLRIGWVSGDLYNHAVATYVLPVVERLADRSDFIQHVYYNHSIEDSVTARFRRYAANWTDVTQLDDDAMAAKIRADGIDILVDLSGHTARNRLPVFARKPAPVQVSWIGYPATTGLSTMDYYLSDAATMPFGTADRLFTEKIVHLPGGVVFQPYETSPPVNALPALSKGYLTFGSFNRINKLHPEVIALWARILHGLPTSRMAIGAITSEFGQQQIAGWFEQAGIARERIEFFDRSNWLLYLHRYQLVDVCLDAFPYSGSTVTGHAAWMGVPTLTIPGDSIQSRTSAGWMRGMKAPEFVATDREDFVRRGIALADDLDHLAQVRVALHGRVQNFVDVATGIIVDSLALAFQTMYQRWCDGLPPEHFAVSAKPPAAQAQPGGAP